VVVEDQEIEHYGIEVNEETKVATCWIASTAGKRFGLWVAKRHADFECVADMDLDGSFMGGVVLIKSDRKPRLKEYVYTGDTSARPFLFGLLRVTDDDSVLNSQQSYEEFGNIKVLFRHITDRKLSSVQTPQLSANDTIHERAKKVVTHRILFGQSTTIERPQTFETCMRQEKVATFIFRYRSIDLLRANRIVPHSPAPVKSVTTEGASASVSAKSSSVSRKRKAAVKEEEPSDVESDSEDEAAKREMAELQAKLDILAERLDRKHKHKKVKREARPVFLPGEVIDLT